MRRLALRSRRAGHEAIRQKHGALHRSITTTEITTEIAEVQRRGVHHPRRFFTVVVIRVGRRLCRRN
jgi:hypothetical protein